IAGDGGLVEDGPDDRNLERQPIEEFPHGLGALLEIDKSVYRQTKYYRDVDAVALHELREVDDRLREGGQVGAESLVQALELRNHEDQQDHRHDDRDRQHRRRVEQRLLHLLLQGLGLFLVGGHLVQERFEGAGMLARFHEIHVQVVEVQRMLAERLVERRAALDIGLDVEDELLHGGLLMPVADDLEGLHERDARGKHGSELAAEYRDVAGIDLAAGAGLALLADSRRRHALAAQLGAQRLLVGREAPALDARAALVLALPGEGDVALDRPDRCSRCRSHALLPSLRHSTVTLLTSSRLVMPLFTFSRPARRRSHTPSLAACAPIFGALPKARMIRTIASVTGNT